MGGELTVGHIGYAAMQLTGPKIWCECPDAAHISLPPDEVDAITALAPEDN